MGLTNKRSKRKVTGGRYIEARKKRVKEKRSLPVLTKIGEKVKRVKRTLGGSNKQTLLKADKANVFDPKTKKMKVVKINSVLENLANRHFVRRNIITKGAIIETELGKAKVTSRPGQEGTINAVLIQ
ncbi:30S ribosomal protein S8e, partial [Candidatus Woesearchaeota archaeon]